MSCKRTYTTQSLTHASQPVHCPAGVDQGGLESQGDYAIMGLNKAGSARGLTAAATQRRTWRNKKKEDGNVTYWLLFPKFICRAQTQTQLIPNANVSKEYFVLSAGQFVNDER